MGSPMSVNERMAPLKEQREIWDAGKAKFYGWLDQVKEEALEPDLPIVESHHHMWDKRAMKGANPNGLGTQQCYMIDDALDDFVGGGHNVTHTVFVTAGAFFTANAEPAFMAPLGEVQAMEGVRAQSASGAYGPIRINAAIVGVADLVGQGAAIEPLLVACKAASPVYRGVKITASHDPKTALKFVPYENMYAEAKFREGFALLEKHGLLFEAWMFSSQLKQLYDLAKAFPKVTIILCHAGTMVAGFGNYKGAECYDGKQAEVIAQWKEGMTALAKDCPNVIMKVGGWGLPFLGTGFSSGAKPPTSKAVCDVFRETFLETIRLFGCARCMLDSDFPVCKVGLSYTVRRSVQSRARPHPHRSPVGNAARARPSPRGRDLRWIAHAWAHRLAAANNAFKTRLTLAPTLSETQVLYNAFKILSKEAGLSEADRALLFGGTAKKVYQIA